MKTPTNTIPAVSLRLTAIALCCLGASCAYVDYTTVKDEPRREVRFASARTAQDFYDAYAAADAPKVVNGKPNTISVGLVVYPPYRRHIKPSENIRFNTAIQAADTNADGVISQKEARLYAAEAGRKSGSSEETN